MSGLGRRLAELQAVASFRLRVFHAKALERLARWLDPLAGTDEVRYRSARDLLLDEVAEGFGDPDSRFYVPPWEVPDDDEVEPMDLSLEQAARRDHIRSALVAELTRVGRKRRRRRQVRRHRVTVFACVLLLTAGVVTGGASALLTGSTGSKAIDAFLDLHAAHDETAPMAANPGPGTDTRPSLDSASDPVTLTVPGSSHRALGVTYVSNDGRLCFVIQTAQEPKSADAPDNLLNCSDPSIAYRGITDSPAVVAGSQLHHRLIFAGFARSDVRQLVMKGPPGRLAVSLADAWTPNTPGAVKIRPFFAVAATQFGPDSVTLDEEHGLIDRRRYSLTAIFDDGRIERVPPDTAP